MVPVADTSRYGWVDTDGECCVLTFEEKNTSGLPGMVNAVVYWMETVVLEVIPGGRAVSLERDMFCTWIGRGVYVYPGGEVPLDIGTPTSLAEAEGLFNTQH
jgi:NDP-sugar pyrophosphorylase family protein